MTSKHSILVTGMLIALFAWSYGREAIASPASYPSASEAEVRRANSEEVEAFIHNDPVAMGRLWSEDLVVTNPLNQFVTKRQVLGMVHAGVLIITAYDRQTEYLRFYGNMAIVAGNEIVLWGGKMPNAGKTEHLRFTGIWMKQRGRWQQIARHANIVPPSGFVAGARGSLDVLHLLTQSERRYLNHNVVAGPSVRLATVLATTRW